MAHFYGGVQGHRGAATRLGTKQSGLVLFAQGWDIGIDVTVRHENGNDVFYVYKTAGTNGQRQMVKRELIGRFKADR